MLLYPCRNVEFVGDYFVPVADFSGCRESESPCLYVFRCESNRWQSVPLSLFRECPCQNAVSHLGETLLRLLPCGCLGVPYGYAVCCHDHAPNACHDSPIFRGQKYARVFSRPRALSCGGKIRPCLRGVARQYAPRQKEWGHPRCGGTPIPSA